MHRIFHVILLLCALGLVFIGGIFAANHHFVRSVFEPDSRISAEAVPDAVRQVFESRFPNAANPEWEFEDGLYDVEMYDGGELIEVGFDKDGGWQHTGRLVSLEQLPPKAKKHLLAEAGTSFRVGDVQRTEFLDGRVHWEVELKNKLYAWDYLYDHDGDLLEKDREQIVED